jgi:hypothetical protein
LCEFKKTVSSMKRRDMLVRLRGKPSMRQTRRRAIMRSSQGLNRAVEQQIK